MDDIAAKIRDALNQDTFWDTDAPPLLEEAVAEIERLRLTDEEREAVELAAGDYLYHQDPGGRAQHIRETLLGLLERTK
jgi:hypothetical protein